MAENRLQEFMARVEQINLNNEYAFKVGRVALFGSLLSNASEVNDIDLAIQLEGRHSDRQSVRNHMLERANVAQANGRVFRSVVQQLLWSRHEIYLFLRARSRIFSFHQMDELAHLSSDQFKMLLGPPPSFLA